MSNKIVARLALVVLSAICGFSLFAKPAPKSTAAAAEFNKSALIICSKGFYEWVCHKFQPTGLKLTNYNEVIKSQNWKETGAKLPPYSELKKYDLVFIAGNPLTAVAKPAFLEYIRNGGTIYMTYTSFTVMKQKTGEMAFGVAGFDGYQELHKIPYTQTEKLTHKVKYTKAMGKEREYTFSTVFTIGARDLVDAIPLIVFSENPDMANTCYTHVGKGRFVYSGFEDLDAVVDVLRVLGLARK